MKCLGKLIFVLLISFPFLGYAQLLSPEQLDTAKVYYSIQQALANPKIVYRINLSKQKLKAFPEELIHFPNLNELVLDKNKIDSIPPVIGKIKYLQILSIQSNKLDTICKEVFWLQHLRKLNLGDNLISYIPTDLEKLQKLEVLGLWDNPIQVYPAVLADLPKLKILDLLNNQMGRNTQERLQNSLPDCRIIMSPPCNCEDEE
jgi:Leucine-rich repeat (LRR) protein